MNTVKPKMSFKRLTDADRAQIAELFEAGHDITAIAAITGRAESTIRNHLKYSRPDLYRPGARPRGPKAGGWIRADETCPRCGLLYRYARRVGDTCYMCAQDALRMAR